MLQRKRQARYIFIDWQQHFADLKTKTLNKYLTSSLEAGLLEAQQLNSLLSIWLRRNRNIITFSRSIEQP
jgi:hypothetical protein